MTAASIYVSIALCIYNYKNNDFNAKKNVYDIFRTTFHIQISLYFKNKTSEVIRCSLSIHSKSLECHLSVAHCRTCHLRLCKSQQTFIPEPAEPLLP